MNVTIKQALERLNLTTQTHLVIRNGEFLTKKGLLEDGDVVKLVAVI